jgi:glucose/arabinose dehydrogenase
VTETPNPAPVTETSSPLPVTETSTSPITFPDPNAYAWQPLVNNLQRPTDLQTDGSGRLFVIEKVGRIRIIENEQLLEVPFLDISDRVGSRGNEQGLLGLAFHPQYQENGRFFVNYTDLNGDTVIARFQVSTDPNVADPNSEVQLLGIDQPFANHNGGVLAFGPDGFLYAGMGDGGSQGDPNGNAQNTSVLLGKILRLDVDSADPYAVPADNPFGNEIWAYGLRNPWRFSLTATGFAYRRCGQNSGGSDFRGSPRGGTLAGITAKVRFRRVMKNDRSRCEYSHQRGCCHWRVCLSRLHAGGNGSICMEITVV